MKLDQSVVARLRRPIVQVWEHIACDAAEMCGNDNEGAIELCFDANRLSTIAGDQEAEDIVRSIVADNDYDEVLSFLSQHIPLV